MGRGEGGGGIVFGGEGGGGRARVMRLMVWLKL
jgi:hypothetical protein